MNINDIFICIGTPKPCLRLNRLAAGAFFAEKQRAFFPNMSVFDSDLYFDGYFVFVHTFENTK